MKSISSRQNPLFRRLREAVREHRDEIVLEGPKSVDDALRHGWKPLALVARGEPLHPDATVFSPDLFDAVSDTRSPQSLLGLFQRPVGDAQSILAGKTSVIIALDAVQDPGNVGTIVRLAAAFDAAGVLLLDGCADPFGPKAIRASAGAILSMPVAPVRVEELIDCGLPLLATAMEGEPFAPPPGACVLILGNEGAGVSQALLESSTRISIPMSGRVESLNVASAAAILLAQAFATRGTRGASGAEKKL